MTIGAGATTREAATTILVTVIVRTTRISRAIEEIQATVTGIAMTTRGNSGEVRLTYLDELRWDFNSRTQAYSTRDERIQRASRAFRTARFRALYRTWLQKGDAVLDATGSPVLQNAMARHVGQWEWRVLPHGYPHLPPLVGIA